MNKKIKVGIVGCGAIGSELALYLDKSLNNYFSLECVADINLDKSKRLVSKLRKVTKVYSISKIVESCDIIIEAGSISCAKEILENFKDSKKTLIILSAGIFVKEPKLIELALKNGNVYVPSGAISGVDGIAALSIGQIKSMRLITSKSPRSLKGADFFKNNNIDISKIKKEKIVFSGSIKDAIKNFPKNINVAVTLFLATNFKKIEVIIKVNPKLKRNVHRIEVDSSMGRLSVEIENVPSKDNPKTSVMAILSTKTLLKKMASNLKIGS